MQGAEHISEKFNAAAYVLGRVAAARPDDTALMVFDGASHRPSEIWSYGGLEDKVLRLSCALQTIGLKMGDRVLIRMGNTAWFPIAFLACLAGGFVPIPTSDRLAQETLDIIFKDSRPFAVLHDGAALLPSGTEGAPVLGPDDLARLALGPLGLYASTFSYDPAYLVYTDGRSGPPRGVLHAQRSILGRQGLQSEWLGLLRGDRILHPGAEDWGKYIGLGLLDPLCKGAASILLSAPKVRAVYGKALPLLLELTGANLVAATPLHYRAALKSKAFCPAPPQNLRASLSCGMALPAYVAEGWSKATKRPLYDGYDLAEIACPLSCGPLCPPKPGWVGKGQSGRKLALLPLGAGVKDVGVGQSGLIAVHRSDPALMLGYWKNVALTKASVRGAWFLTGDLGWRGRDGYIRYQGRLSDLIKLKGVFINPEDIEAAIASLPGVQEAAVAKGRMQAGRESLIGFIVPEKGAVLTIDALDFALGPLLEEDKRPKQWFEVDALPRTAGGKIARAVLSRFAA